MRLNENWLLPGGSDFPLGWGESEEYLLALQPHSHISLVVVAYLLDPDVILGVNKRLCCGICLGEGHHTSNVLEVVVVFHFDLTLEQGREEKRRQTNTYTESHKSSEPLNPSRCYSSRCKPGCCISLGYTFFLASPQGGERGPKQVALLCLLEEVYLGNTHNSERPNHLLGKNSWRNEAK